MTVEAQLEYLERDGVLSVYGGARDDRFGLYEGRVLAPSYNALCGNCIIGWHDKCIIWLPSPGSPAEKKCDGRVPCVCVCEDKKGSFLDRIFGGANWRKNNPRRGPQDLRVGPVGRSVGESSSSLAADLNQEVAVSDTSTEAPTEPEAVTDASDSPDWEYPEGEGQVTVEEVPAGTVLSLDVTDEIGNKDYGNDEAQVDSAQPVTDGSEPSSTTEPSAEASEPAPKAVRADLEGEVKTVTDDFVTGAFSTEGAALTPHRVAKEIFKRRNSEGKNPSPGAVTACFNRWREYGFALFSDKPFAFQDYTDAGRERGLAALKAEYRASNKKEAPASE